MKLSILQQNSILENAIIGMNLFDILILMGIKPEEAIELQNDSEIRALYLRGIAEGSNRVKLQVAKSAERGNYQATKLWHKIINADTPEEPEPTYAPAYKSADVVKSVSEAFERQKALQELCHAEMNP